MNPDQLIDEITDKWNEYIEMADDKSAIKCKLLANLLIKERQKNEYLEKRMKTLERIYDVSF
jgi:chaperone required for assembly of F1-ATPase